MPPVGDTSSHEYYPPMPDPANEESGYAELYPARLQDEVNASYIHNKVLPRVEGTDYMKTKEDVYEEETGTEEQGERPEGKERNT
jgi:hypothetical protein